MELPEDVPGFYFGNFRFSDNVDFFCFRKQISVIVVLFALGTHLVVFGCLRWRHSNYFLAMNSIKKTESDNNANGTEATAAQKILQAQTSSAESEISQTSNLSSEFESR